MRKLILTISAFSLIAFNVLADQNRRQEVFFWDYGDKTSATINRVLNMKKDVDTTTFVLSGGEWSVTNNVTFPTNSALRVAYGSTFAVDNGSTVALPNVLFDAEGAVVFTGAGNASGDAIFFYRYPVWGDTTQYNIGDGVLTEAQIETWIENGDLTFAGGTTQSFDNAYITNLTAEIADIISNLAVGGDLGVTSNLAVGGTSTFSGPTIFKNTNTHESGSHDIYENGSSVTYESNSVVTYETGSSLVMATNSLISGDGFTQSIVEVITNSSEIVTLLTPAGTVLASFATATPDGYLYCNGTNVSRTTYANLYAAIGDSCGEGDGSTTFTLPDLRGRFLRGQDDGASRDPDDTSRTAMATGGNTGDAVGSVQGHALQAHTHSVSEVGGGTNVHPGSPAEASSSDDENVTTGGASGSTSTETRPVNAYVRYYIKY